MISTANVRNRFQGFVTATACLLSLAATVLAGGSDVVAPCVETKAANAWPDPSVSGPGGYAGGLCYQLCVLREGSLTYCAVGKVNQYCTTYNVTAICQTRGKWLQNPDGSWGCKNVQQGYFTANITSSYGEFPCLQQ